MKRPEAMQHIAKAGTSILSSGIIDIDVLAPFADSDSNLNNVSAVVRITYGKTVMLFTGDGGIVISSFFSKMQYSEAQNLVL